MAMTIDQVKSAKIEIEKKIIEMLQKFEDDSGVIVSYVEMDREHTRDCASSCCCHSIPVPEPERTGKIANIDLRLRFEL